jgi:hypothetical protein
LLIPAYRSRSRLDTNVCLAWHIGDIIQLRHLERLALFGSIARNAAKSGSDVDVLVAFDGPATSKRYFGVRFYLEDLLGCPVDLVTEKALRPELRPHIEQERVQERVNV